MPTSILVKYGTITLWAASGGDALLTLTSLANGAGRIGAQVDLGATRAGRYRFQIECRFGTAPTAGNAVELYLATSDDNTFREGNLGSTDAAVSDGDLRGQLTFVGILAVDNQNTAAQIRTFEIECGARYISPVVWNAAGQAFSSTASHHNVRMWPVITEAQ